MALTLLEKQVRRQARRDPDTAIMLRVRRDEPGAFEELVETFGRRVYACMVQSLPDRHEAEDMTQEVFLRLYRSRKRYEPRAKFATWLFHIAHNVARNALRSRRRHARLQFGCLEIAEESVLKNRHDLPDRYVVSDPVERDETTQRLRHALTHLLERQRKALEMQHLQHRTYAEIADAFQLSPTATKSLLYRARLQLREAMGQSEEP